MPQNHLDRLTSIDASFLHQEGTASHMHIGGVLIFEGPPPAFEDYLDHVRGRLHLVPRYRQKLSFPPLESGRPLWVDDPRFNLEYHVRHTALPSPGSFDQLRQLAGRVFSQRLDRTKPLWEMWLVQGLEQNRFAVLSKTHHSMIDGISGVDLASVLFDTTPVPNRVDAEPWTPHPEPSDAELIAAGATNVAKRPFGLLGGAIGAARHPRSSLGSALEAAEGLGEFAWAILNPAPDTPLNVPIGPHRRLVEVSSRL